jgi:hypothetical protein
MAFAGVVRKLRLVTAFAKERGKVAALTETGGKKRRRDFWTFLHRVATAEGVGIAFVNTWSRYWGTIPLSPEEAENQRSFALRPEVIMEGPGNGFRPTPLFAAPYKRHPIGEDSLRQKNSCIFHFPIELLFFSALLCISAPLR